MKKILGFLVFSMVFNIAMAQRLPPHPPHPGHPAHRTPPKPKSPKQVANEIDSELRKGPRHPHERHRAELRTPDGKKISHPQRPARKHPPRPPRPR